MVGVSASVNLPLHHKVQKFSSGTGSPRWSRKKGRKMVVCVCCGLPLIGNQVKVCQCRNTSELRRNTMVMSVARWVSQQQQLLWSDVEDKDDCCTSECCVPNHGTWQNTAIVACLILWGMNFMKRWKGTGNKERNVGWLVFLDTM